MLEKIRVLRNWKKLKQIYNETPKDIYTALAKLDMEIQRQRNFCKEYMKQHKELTPNEQRVIFDYLIVLKQLRQNIDVFMTAEKKTLKVKQLKPIAEKLKELTKSKIETIIDQKEFGEYGR